MGASHSILLLFLLGGILRLQEAAGGAWGVTYRELAVTVTEGMEVELPCWFWFPWGQGPVTRGLWMRNDIDIRADNIVYSSTSTKVAESYRGRTSLSGDLSHKSCSLKIKNVAVSDTGTYYFRFELETQGFTGPGGVQLRVKCAGKKSTDSWVVYGPSVRVWEGDRVVLPCAFCSPWSSSQSRVQGVWSINSNYYNTRNEDIVHNSEGGVSLREEYKGRVTLVGSLSSGTCSLEIRDVRWGDAKTYFFHGYIDGSWFRGATGIQVTVSDGPFTPNTEGKKIMRVKVGTRATLTCTTTSSQITSYFGWSKHRSAGYYKRMSETGQHLTLEAVGLEDRGWYECENGAWYSWKTIEHSWMELQVFSVPVRVALTPAQPALRASVPATLGCRVDAVFPRGSVNVSWVLDNVQWKQSTDESESADGTFTVTTWLSFTPSAEDHGKKCRCEASGRDLLPTRVQNITLDVKYAPVNTTASVRSAPRRSTVKSGDNVTLTCAAHGNPRPTWFTWSREPPSGRLLPHNSTDGTRLLKNVTAEDSGRYRCVSFNSEGRGASALLDLDVQYAPVMLNASQDEACGGGDVCLLCEVTANPRATITWASLVGSEGSEWNQTQGGDGTLTRSSVVMKRSQEQKVTCVARNDVGETKAVLHVKGLETSASLQVAAGVGGAFLLLLLSALCWRGRVLAAAMKRNEAAPAAPLQLGDRSVGQERMQAPPGAGESAADGGRSLAVSEQPLYSNVRRELGPDPRSQPHPRVGPLGGSAGTPAPNADADCLYSLVGTAAQAEEPGALYTVVNYTRATPGSPREEATVYSRVRLTGAAVAPPSGAAAEGGAASGGGGDAEEQQEALVYASLHFSAT